MRIICWIKGHVLGVEIKVRRGGMAPVNLKNEDIRYCLRCGTRFAKDA